MVESHLKELGLSTRVFRNRISILNKDEMATYQLTINSHESNHLISVSSLGDLKKAKILRRSGHAQFLYAPRRKKLFTVELHDNTSITKIDEWAKEIQSKLK